MTVLRLTHEPLKITDSNAALLTSEPGVVLNTLISYKTNTTTKSNCNRDEFNVKKNDACEHPTHIRELDKEIKSS